MAGATVVTRTVDRDFWTFSEPSDANGNYTSFFAASDKSQDDPVPLSVQVALGPVSYSSGLIPTVKFKRLRSARMDVQLPARVGGVLPLPTSTSYEGAVYQGLLVGASAGGRVVKPVAAQWPDAKGRFRLVLPGVGARQDGAALAEQLPGVRDLPGQARRRGRPAHVARRPLAARLDRDGERRAARADGSSAPTRGLRATRRRTDAPHGSPEEKAAAAAAYALARQEADDEEEARAARRTSIPS